MQSWKKLKVRPVSEFLETGRFSVPNTNQLEKRVRVNIIYYQANYFVIVLALLVLAMLLRPLMIVSLLISAAAGIYIFNIRARSFVFNGRVVTKNQTTVGFAAASTVLFFLCGGAMAILAISVGLLVSLVHCILRTESLKARGTTYADVDLWSGSTPLGSAVHTLEEEENEEQPLDEENPVKLATAAKARSQFRAQRNTSLRKDNRN